MPEVKELLIILRKDGKIYAPLKNKWLVETTEELVRQSYICYLVNECGYSLEQMEQDYHSISNTSDVIIWKNKEDKLNEKSPMIVIGCYTNHHVKNEDYLEVENYALLADVKFFVTHYYESEEINETRVFKFLEEKPPLQVQEIEMLPSADILENEEEVNKILSKTKEYSKDIFQKLFFACHDIIRNNDKLSPEMAFDEISKILFIKIKFEKENGYIFTKELFLSQQKDYQILFQEVKAGYENDKIFEAQDKLRIKETTFLQILEKLQKYNFAEISEDLKGVAFEEFLGKTFRGNLGQFFTPRTLVEFMVKILDPQEGELIADPCCGSGGFLIKSFEVIKEKIKNHIRKEKNKLRKELIAEDFHQKSEEVKNQINTQIIKLFRELEKDLDVSNPDSRLYKLANDCIFGADAEPRSARTAKMNMIMQGDGHSGVHHHDGLLNINGLFDNRFDIIVTKPPFGASVSKELMVKEYELEPKAEYIKRYGKEYEQIYTKNLKFFRNHKKKKEEGLPLLEFYETGAMSGLTEVLFVERCLNLLKKGGRLGIVLPEGFLNGSNLQKARDFVESKAKILAVVSVPQDVFISAGASVKSSLVFLKKFTVEEEKEYKNTEKQVTQEIKQKYQSQIEEKEKEHKRIWEKIQDKREYKRDVQSIRASKSEKELQFMIVDGDIRVLQKEHKIRKAEFDSWKKELDLQIETEIKAEIKTRFNYQFPIVQVAKAGISSTGQKIENDLLDVRVEFEQYRKITQLWQSQSLQYTYNLDEAGNLLKIQERINF